MLSTKYFNCLNAIEALDNINTVLDSLIFNGAILEEETDYLEDKLSIVSTFLTAYKENLETELLKDTYEIDRFEPIHE